MDASRFTRTLRRWIRGPWRLFGTRRPALRAARQGVAPPRVSPAMPASLQVAAHQQAPTRIHTVQAARTHEPSIVSASVARLASAVQKSEPPISPAGPVPARPRQAAVAPPPTKTTRTLEEVRADLARLREKSKQKQAEVQIQAALERCYAPTDFMDFASPAPVSRRTPSPAKQPAVASRPHVHAPALETRVMRPTVRNDALVDPFAPTAFSGLVELPPSAPLFEDRSFEPTAYAGLDWRTAESAGVRDDPFSPTVFSGITNLATSPRVLQ